MIGNVPPPPDRAWRGRAKPYGALRFCAELCVC